MDNEHIGQETVKVDTMAKEDHSVHNEKGSVVDEGSSDECTVDDLDVNIDNPNHEGCISRIPNIVSESNYAPITAKVVSIMKYFSYEHEPPHLQEVSKPIGQLAQLMADLPDGPEKSAGLRKLLEAKDCFVRAKLG